MMSCTRRRAFRLLVLLPAWPALAFADFAGALTITDGGFTPTQLDVPAGERLQLDVTNATTAAVEFESPALNREKVVPPGKTVRVFAAGLEPGRYDFFDETHKERRGVLVVR